MTDLWADRWGLRDLGAYAGDEKHAISRMPGSAALRHRFIQANPSRMLNALVIDIDRPSAVMDALERPHEHPDPSWVIETSRGAHVGWWLSDPVCRSEVAELKPLRYAARVQEGLVRLLGADPAFAGFITRNPTYPLLGRGEVIWGAETTYELAELRTSAMPRQLPRKAMKSRSDLGRNCALFEEGRHEVYRLNRAMDYPGADALFHASLSHLLDLNTAIPTDAGGPLPLSEVRAMATSIAKWTSKNHSREGFIQHQQHAGTKSGEKRRLSTPAKLEEFLND
ncbi:replication initiation protein [Corynebacterium sp. SA-MJD20WY100]|uniref:replication initiation protein n=1 Tax=Corynebacterium sp. SA-MJD20WY100 TaxID=3142969 RepID=UPI0032213EBC